MPDQFIDFLPLVGEDADSVRARFDADANAGLDPADPGFQDVTVGGFYWDLTQGAVLECVRLWDLIGTEMVAASFPGTAWGDYLDLHGETVGLTRKDEAAARGRVLFVGDVGLLVPASTEVSTVQPDPSGEADPVIFSTDSSITLVATPGPVGLAAVGSGSGGTLPAGTYYYVVTAIGADGETVASNEVEATLAGATSSVDLTWTAYAGAISYRIYRSGITGEETLLVEVGLVTTHTDTGADTTGPEPAPTNTVDITAEVAGSVGNVLADTITQVLTPLDPGPSVTNPSATSGGADVEDDDQFRVRILAEYAKSSGAGTVSDYINWALSNPAVGFVTVQPLWAGAGTVRVIINDPQNQPLPASVVADVQNDLDPIPGQGAGRAPIGAIVTVVTTATLDIDVAAKLVLDSAYSLDGAGGTIALRDSINSVLNTYLSTLPPGADVILHAVVRQFMAIPGVLDVHSPAGTGLPELNGAQTNVTVGALEVATPGTYTLTV